MAQAHANSETPTGSVLMRWPDAADEIIVNDGHLTIRLSKLGDSWYAQVESSIEGKIFEGRITELSDLLAGNPVVDALADLNEDFEGN